MSPSTRLKSVLVVVRWHEWAHSKVPALFGGYLLAAVSGDGMFSVAEFAAWLFSCVTLFAYGYAVNDYSDKDLDERAGKPNALGQLGSGSSASIVSALALLALSPVLLFFHVPLAAALVLCSVGLATAYSLQPLRLKKRGWLGIVAAAAAQRVLPLGTGLALLGTQPSVALPLVALFSAVGVRWMLLHQLVDAENDKKGGLTTVVSRCGADVIVAWMVFILIPFELACLGLALWIGDEDLWLLRLALIPLFLLWLLIKWRVYAGRAPIFNLKAFWMHPLADLYEFVMPVWFGLILAWTDREALPIIAFLLVWLAPAWWRKTARLRRSAIKTGASP